MTLIQTDQKAITADQAQAILDDSIALKNPLGIPTLYLRPEEFGELIFSVIDKKGAKGAKGEWFPELKRLEEAVREKIQNFTAAPHFEEVAAQDKDHVTERFTRSAPQIATGLYLAKMDAHGPKYSLALVDHKEGMRAIKTAPDDFVEPAASLVCLPPSGDDVINVHQAILGPDVKGLSPDMPGSYAEYRFALLWHEIGHGTGAEEPQTQAISAIMTRRAFADPSSISAQADARAVLAVLSAEEVHHDIFDQENRPANELYGWPMVEVADHIVHMDGDVVDGLGEQDIKNIRFQNFDHLTETVLDVAAMIYANNADAYEQTDIPALAQTARQVREGISITDDENQILKRFELACHRLNIGKPAYDQGAECIEQDVREADHAQPLTFTAGEWIPE